MTMTTHHKLGAALLAALLTLTPTQAGEVDEKITGWAREIQRLLKDEGQTEIAVGEFVGPTSPVSGAGPMIQASLLAELKKLNVGVNDKAFTFVKGEFFVLEEEKKNDYLVLRLMATIRNKKGRKIDELSADIGYRGNDDLVKLLTLTVDLAGKLKADRQKQNEELRKQVDKPSLVLDGTKIKVSEKSLFAVELLVRRAGEKVAHPCKAENVDGQAFVNVNKGEEYELQLHNNSTYEAAVSVVIDGVDAFQFYDGPGTRPSRFLVGAGQTRLVRGWARDTHKVNAFLVGSFADSAAAKTLKGSAKIGSISVLFHPSWEQGKQPPDYDGTRSTDDRATIIGREIKEKSQVVQRVVGPLQEAIGIRYKR